ncbi:nucleotidyltransferase domain-containing protein [Halomonas llamarensis]|uniref:Nucleotidyltransferase domain-containing protein n=1 Tax=Halomonas llamarensis TaxID=2945104 RepID=A0ABT0SLC0_9GAMM|nr:nucleotidyltransferase domain-containing protein [Halomonas llamarensis]MCL7928598.1 nucleotidyltransferase domain-containing protein [Halomonas llamarensis]
MRLQNTDIHVIKRAVKDIFGPEAYVTLFGSRVDDTAKGGDIDLMVTVPHPVEKPAWGVAKVQTALILKLGERKIDIVLSAPNLQKTAIHRVAQEQGVPL